MILQKENQQNLKSNLIQILLYMGGIFAFLSGIFLFFFPSCIVNINLDTYYCLKLYIPSIIVFMLLGALQVFSGIILRKQNRSAGDIRIILIILGLILAIILLFWREVVSGFLLITLGIISIPFIYFLLLLGFCFIVSLILNKKLKKNSL